MPLPSYAQAGRAAGLCAVAATLYGLAGAVSSGLNPLTLVTPVRLLSLLAGGIVLHSVLPSIGWGLACGLILVARRRMRVADARSVASYCYGAAVVTMGAIVVAILTWQPSFVTLSASVPLLARVEDLRVKQVLDLARHGLAALLVVEALVLAGLAVLYLVHAGHAMVVVLRLRRRRDADLA